LVRKKVVSRLKNVLYNWEMAGAVPMLATVNSYFGHFKYACSFNLKKDIYKNHLGEMKKMFIPKNNYMSLKLEKEKI
jgi:hypothetical protein